VTAVVGQIIYAKNKRIAAAGGALTDAAR